jgi:predicted secreted hydrolase
VMSPQGPRRFEIRAVLDDQRMDTLIRYWEGMVRVIDDDGRRIGTGYMELTGYD